MLIMKTVTTTVPEDAYPEEKPRPRRKPRPRPKRKPVLDESEDQMDMPIEKKIKPTKPKRKKPKRIYSEDENAGYKGVECSPDCPCENEGNCDNPCMELKCEII